MSGTRLFEEPLQTRRYGSVAAVEFSGNAGVGGRGIGDRVVA